MLRLAGVTCVLLLLSGCLGTAGDLGAGDAGVVPDAGSAIDAGADLDGGGPLDADAGRDAGGDDAGGQDAGGDDAGDADAGPGDAGLRRVYLEGGDDFRLTVSDDEGVTWRRVQPVNLAGDDFVNDIAVANGHVLFIGLPGLYASDDGAQTFSLVGAVTHNGFDTYGGQLNVGANAVLLTDNQGTWSSSDATVWTSLDPFPSMPNTRGFGGHFHGRAFGNGVFLAFQDGGRLRRFDGTAWSATTLAGEFNGVTFGNGLFVAVGAEGMQGFVTTSADGQTWSAHVTQDAAAMSLRGQLSSIAWDGAKFMIFTRYGGNAAYSSPDAVTWTPVTLSGSVEQAVFEDGAWFGIGNNKLVFSNDGRVWRVVHDLASDETQNINGPRLAVGRARFP